jgi:hypothetical protein
MLYKVNMGSIIQTRLKVFIKKQKTLNDFFFLTLIVIITYWPVAFQIFSLKNDSLVQYLPYRYHLSESIQNGYFPFWSPYLYTGVPIHADLQGMTWNPIVLIISLITQYDMSVLQIEVTAYLILCAIGMYSLLKSFSLSRVACLTGAVAYVCCGYITDSASVIPWVSSAAFIPFVFTAFHYLLKAPSLKFALLFSIALLLFFVCCYPSLFIYSGYIISFITLLHLIGHLKSKRKEILIFFSYLLLAVVLFLLIASPAIISYWEYLPYYSRGSGISYSLASTNNFPVFSSISFITANSVSKNHPWIVTDLSMRNTYTGLFFCVFLGLSLFKQQTNKLKTLFAIVIFSFLYSLGASFPIHQLAYKYLPLFNTFRHSGNMRLFTIIGTLIISTTYFNELFTRPHLRDKKIVSLTLKILGFSLLTIFCLILFKQNTINSIRVIANEISAKQKLDVVSFDLMLAFICLLQAGFAFAFVITFERDLRRLFISLFFLNSIIFAWIGQPFTFISQVRTSTVDRYLSSFPKGYPLQAFHTPVGAHEYSNLSNVSLIGYKNFYNKNITIQDYIINPTMNRDYTNFLTEEKLRKNFANYLPVYLSESNSQDQTTIHDDQNTKGKQHNERMSRMTKIHSLKVLSFGPNHLDLEIWSSKYMFLNVFQQYNHNWHAYINGVFTPIYKTNIAFIGVRVPIGKTHVRLEYKSSLITKMTYASIMTLIIVLVSILFLLKRERQSCTKISPAII